MTTFDCLAPNLVLSGYHAIEASAGTGKTFAIQHLVARLLLQSMPFNDILIVTFTRASARELKSRIRSNLVNILQDPPPYFMMLSPEEKIIAQLCIEEALAIFDQAQIFTIHGFCQRMLTEFGFETKMGPFLLSGEEENYREALVQEVTDFFHTSLSSSYSARQLVALMKHCGFDKEKLIKKILYFIEQGGELPNYPDYQTSRDEFYALDLPFLSLDKFLHFAPAFLKICNRRGVLKEKFQVQYQALLSKNFDELLTNPSLFAFLHPQNRSKKLFIDEDLQSFYKLHDILTPLITKAIDPKHTLIRMAREAQCKVKQALIAKDLFSPDDLLFQMEQTLSNVYFRSKVHAHYKAVIIDEFQDTDSRQWSIFKTLFVDQPIEAFYIVGDPKQSIYGFRNADLNTYLDAKKSMEKISQLNINYRSEPSLVNSLNLLFSRQKHFPYLPVHAAPEMRDTLFSDHKNSLHFFTATVQKKRERNWPSSSIETEYFFPFIAEEIQGLTKKKEAKFKDFTILVKDRYQAARIKNYLEQLNIPVSAKNTEPLTQTSAYTFLKSFLIALVDPQQTYGFLAHPIFAFTHQELRNNLHTNAIAFFHKKEQPFYKVIDAALNYEWKSEQTLVEVLVQNRSLDIYADFMQLIELLLAQSDQSPPHLLQYLIGLPSDQVKYCRHPLSDLNTVSIMTIHMSKGLEFSIVFALGVINRYVSEQDFILHKKKWLLLSQKDPLCQAALQDQKAEKMRQLYVALTRAKKRLYVPMLFDSSYMSDLSKASSLELFLKDLPPLKQLLPAIHATYTQLKPTNPHALSVQTPTLHPPLIRRTTFSTHHIQSFSSLTNHTSVVSPEIPEDALPKGTATGLLLHNLFERIILEKLTYPYQTKTIHDLIESTICHTDFYPHLTTIRTLIDLAFHYPLKDFCLVDILPQHLHAEVEFFYSDTSDTSLKGFIDLIFFYDNSYYILDWKTNVLADYKIDTLHQAMKQNEYFLQAKIYGEALKRYLALKGDTHPIAGVYYLFLRGLSKGQGLYFHSMQ